MKFYDALKHLQAGNKITRLSWGLGGASIYIEDGEVVIEYEDSTKEAKTSIPMEDIMARDWLRRIK